MNDVVVGFVEIRGDRGPDREARELSPNDDGWTPPARASSVPAANAAPIEEFGHGRRVCRSFPHDVQF